ncbi:hypothetical protein GW17_00027585 [Ensete ventricosum]|nr:hypothetical protein GW17_00027585 [Ensete ventricosum]
MSSLHSYKRCMLTRSEVGPRKTNEKNNAATRRSTSRRTRRHSAVASSSSLHRKKSKNNRRRREACERLDDARLILAGVGYHCVGGTAHGRLMPYATGRCAHGIIHRPSYHATAGTDLKLHAANQSPLKHGLNGTTTLSLSCDWAKRRCTAQQVSRHGVITPVV